MATQALGRGLRTGLSALPIASTENVAKAEEMYAPSRARATEAMAEQALLGEGVSFAKGQEAKAKESLAQGVREAGTESLRLGAEEEKGLMDVARQEREKNPFPTFSPTQEDAMSYGQLGSMIATLGVMLGAGGKVSAKAAIGSMTGMMNGWKQGRRDLWEKEAKTFEKEVNRIKMVRDSIQKDLETGLKLASTNRAASKAALESAAHKAGSGSVIDSMIATGRAVDALELAKKSANLAKETDNKILDMATRQTQHEASLAAAERQRQATLETARIRAEVAKEKAGTGVLKPGAEVTKNYLGTNALVEDMKDIASSLKNPKMQKMIDDYQLEGFASEELGKIGAQIANTQLPSELRQFLVKVRNIRNNYYLTISGKAVTGGEALRNYGVVPQPGDKAAVMADKVDAMLSQANRTINQYRTLYGLPAINEAAMNQLRSSGKDGTFDVRNLPVEDQQENIIDVPGKGKFRKLPNGNFEKVD
jgi:hypothetical protein